MSLGASLTFKQRVMDSKSSLSKKSILDIQLIYKISVDIHNHQSPNSVFLINNIIFFLCPYFVSSLLAFVEQYSFEKQDLLLPC